MADDAKDVFQRQHISASDRGIALAAFAYLESKIDKCIFCLCVNEKAGQRLIKSGIKTAAIKINLLHCFGAISDEAYSDLDLIRKIRNIFAHEMSVDSFSDPKINCLIEKISLSPRESIYGTNNEHEKYHDEFISNIYGDFKYSGAKYLHFCGFYANRFQSTQHNLLTTTPPLPGDPSETLSRRSLRLPLF